MAAVGMLHIVAAPITSHTDGTAITYGAGFLVGPAVDASITFNYNDNPDYGDDIVQGNDNGLNGYSGTIESNQISVANAAKLYGWEGKGTGDNIEYEASDGAAPQLGFGYVRKMLDKTNTVKIRAFWFHMAQFTPASYANAHTKERQISWQHDTSNITGFGAYLDASGKAKYFIVKEFATVADAETWLDNKANI